VLPPFAARAQTPAQVPAARFIDVHHHVYPPRYASENIQRLLDDTATLPASRYTGWTVRADLDDMDKAGVASAIASITSPGVWFGDDQEGRKWARVCNEYGAELVRDFPGRYGMFAAIPLPDTEGSLREIDYAFGTLKLDGIGVLTSYKGRLLGDPGFAPVMDELNRRKAIVFVHPTMSCCGNTSVPALANPSLEFPFDTTRTIASLLYSGTFARCPDLRFVFSHGGGAVPMLYQRIAGAINFLKPEERATRVPNGVDHELRRQYYDLASVGTNPAGMAAVLKVFPPSQLLYGSDVPFGTMPPIVAGLERLGLPPADLAAIARGNAAALFPRFQA
jgi:predicted TIM-barrel fold metal-dependent hydrolase